MDPSDLTRYERRAVPFNTWGDSTLHGAYGRGRGARRAATPTSVRGGRLGRRSHDGNESDGEKRAYQQQDAPSRCRASRYQQDCCEPRAGVSP